MRDAGGIVIGTVLGSPWLGTNVTVPVRGSLPVLTTATPMSALPPGAAEPPAQYHVDDSALAGGATGMLPVVVRTAALGRPKLWSMKPAARITTSSTIRAGARRTTDSRVLILSPPLDGARARSGSRRPTARFRRGRRDSAAVACRSSA